MGTISRDARPGSGANFTRKRVCRHKQELCGRAEGDAGGVIVHGREGVDNGHSRGGCGINLVLNRTRTDKGEKQGYN
eukprot:768199-Hanusia_phi.AAC.4